MLIQSFITKSSTKSFFRNRMGDKTKKEKHQIVDVSFNNKSLCSTIGLIVKSSLHLEGIDLVKKELKYEIEDLDIKYNKINKREFSLYILYLVTIENNIQL